MLKCNGWEITTVESQGNKLDGYDTVATALASESGTQCGFCSPGMVMAMYSLLDSDPDPTVAKIEEILDGNICRCTGYRPIFEAFKSFASDATPKQKKRVTCF